MKEYPDGTYLRDGDGDIWISYRSIKGIPILYHPYKSTARLYSQVAQPLEPVEHIVAIARKGASYRWHCITCGATCNHYGERNTARCIAVHATMVQAFDTALRMVQLDTTIPLFEVN